jgi:hypothetical protein
MNSPRQPPRASQFRREEPQSLPDRDEARAREVLALEKRIAASWVFDCASLYPVDRDEIEKLKQNPIVNLWLNRIKRLRTTYGKVTITGVRQQQLAKQRIQSLPQGMVQRTAAEKEIEDDDEADDLPSSIKRSIANVPIVGEEKHSFYINTRRAWLEACVRDQNDLDRMLEMIQRHAPSGSKLDEMPIIREAKHVQSKNVLKVKNFVKTTAAMRGFRNKAFLAALTKPAEPEPAGSAESGNGAAADSPAMTAAGKLNSSTTDATPRSDSKGAAADVVLPPIAGVAKSEDAAGSSGPVLRNSESDANLDKS